MNQHTLAIPSLRGRKAVITGTGGLGLEVSLALARAGAQVVVSGRNHDKGEAAVAAIRAAVPEAAISFAYIDLAKLDTVAGFANSMQAAGSPVDILVNNAGIMSPPVRKLTADGFELQFGVNFLGHFALTAHLIGLLRSAPAPRVVNVTSLAHRFAPMDFDDLQSERQYKPGLAYCRSKLAQALFVQELQRRSDRLGWGIASMGAHPGVARTNLFNNEERPQGRLGAAGSWLMGTILGQSAKAGALPVIHAAASPEAEGGQLYGPRGFFEMKGQPGRCEYAAHAQDPGAAERLWDIAQDLTRVRFPE